MALLSPILRRSHHTPESPAISEYPGMDTGELQAINELPSAEQAKDLRLLVADLGIAWGTGDAVRLYGAESIKRHMAPQDDIDVLSKTNRIEERLVKAALVAQSAEIVKVERGLNGITPEFTPEEQENIIERQKTNAWYEGALTGDEAVVVLESLDEAARQDRESRVTNMARHILQGIQRNHVNIMLDDVHPKAK